MESAERYGDIHAMCRICLELLHDENAYDLFAVPGLAKKLCVCAALSVEPHDGFPKCICGVCYTRLNDLHAFQKFCIDSVQRFQAMINSKVFNIAGSASNFDMLEAGPSTVESLQQSAPDDDERINFDPLLNHKMDLIETEDVFKLLEHVDKEAEEQTIIMDKNYFGSEETPSEGDEFLSLTKQDDLNDYLDELPLASRLRRTSKRNKMKQAMSDIETEKPKQQHVDNEDESVDEQHEEEEEQRNEDNEVEDEDEEDEDYADEENNENVRKLTKVQRRKRLVGGSQHSIECHICRKKFKKVTRYHSHMKYHNDKLPHLCKVGTCLKGFTTANGLRLHVEHCHAETIESFSCPEEGCGRTFPRTRLLNWHLKKVHKIVKELSEPKCYPCNGCDKIFRCPMSLKKHMYKHDGKELPFPCNICGKRFVINSALKDHLMRHAGIKNYVCPYCGVGKTTRQEWNTHINTHTQEKKFKCLLCPHASHNKQNLRMHVKIVHEKIKDYACQYCGKTFGKSNACKMHEMTHTGEKRCECKVCGKRFLYAKSLTKHLKTHEKRVLRAIEVYRKRQMELGELPPDASPAPLPALPELANHSQETHQKVADEILKVCAESAASIPKDPRRVERVDIEQLAGTAVNPIAAVAVPSWSPQINFMMKEGPHICPDCGQGFNGPSNLKRHHRIVHEGVKDFACRFCHRRFAKAQTLKHHEMTHTGEKPHECQQCGKRFIQYVALKRHMKVHSILPPIIPVSVYVAREELQLQERAKLQAKRQALEERAAIAEAAKEQLSEMQQSEWTNVDDVKPESAPTPTSPIPDLTTLGDFPIINTSTMGTRTLNINDTLER